MFNFPTSFEVGPRQLPTDLGRQGNDATALLKENGYTVLAGLTPFFAGAIAMMALEPAIQQNCPNDTTKRFGTELLAKRWVRQPGGRGVFVLTQDSATGPIPAGYGWTGPGTTEHVESGQVTFAMRIGERHTGKGLAYPFAALIVAASVKMYDATDIWLETWASNITAHRTYERVGFVETHRSDAEINAAHATDQRIYMYLPNDRLPVQNP